MHLRPLPYGLPFALWGIWEWSPTVHLLGVQTWRLSISGAHTEWGWQTADVLATGSSRCGWVSKAAPHLGHGIPIF